MNNIVFLCKNKNWQELVKNLSPTEIVKSLSFRDGLSLAYRLLYNNEWDQDLQEFAIKLLYTIRNVYPELWQESWQYDALLGNACYITRKYDERYEAFKRAFKEAKDPPPGLLVEFARCCICPGSPPISYDEAIILVLRALKEAPYADAIGLLGHLYSLKGDIKNKDYWREVFKNSNQKFVTAPIEPKFLIVEYLHEKKPSI